MNHEDSVIKRNGKKETISFDKILKRVKKLGAEGEYELNVNYTALTKKIIDRLYDGISTTLIDELTAQQCASLATLAVGQAMVSPFGQYRLILPHMK